MSATLASHAVGSGTGAGASVADDETSSRTSTICICAVVVDDGMLLGAAAAVLARFPEFET